MFFQYHEGASDLVDPNTRIRKKLASFTVGQGMDIVKAWPWELSLPLFSTSSAIVLKTVTFMIGGSEWQTLRLKPPFLDRTALSHLSVFGVWREKPQSVMPPSRFCTGKGWRSQSLAFLQWQCLKFSGLVLGSCTFKSRFWGLQLIVTTCMKGKWPPSTAGTMHLLQPDSSISQLHFYMDMQNKKIKISFSNLIKTVY